MASARFGVFVLTAALVVATATPAFAANTPVVDAVVPGHGTAAGGTAVQITGSGFTGATQVAFGAATIPPCAPSVVGNCFRINNDNRIGTNSPAGPVSTTVDVTVSVGSLTSATNVYAKYTFDPASAPVVSGVTPRSGPASGGIGVAILGSGFSGATEVAFGTSRVTTACPVGLWRR